MLSCVRNDLKFKTDITVSCLLPNRAQDIRLMNNAGCTLVVYGCVYIIHICMCALNIGTPFCFTGQQYDKTITFSLNYDFIDINTCVSSEIR